MIQALSHEIRVGIRCSITRCDIEHSIETEGNRGSVMTIRRPLNDKPLGTRQDVIGRFAPQGDARHARLLRRAPVTTDEHVSIFSKLWMEADTEFEFLPLEQYGVTTARRIVIG